MNNYLDIRTLALMMGVVSITLAVGMIYLQSYHKTYSGFSSWSIGSVCAGIGGILLCMRGYAPQFVSIIVANTLLVLCFSFIAWGVERFVERKISRWPDYVLLALFIGIFLQFTYIKPSVEARIIIVSLCFSYFSGKALLLLKYQDPHLRYPLLLNVLWFAVIWFFLRSAITAFVPWEITNFMKAGAFHAVSIIIFIVTQVMVTIALILANHHKLENELTESNLSLKDSEKRFRSLSDASFEGIVISADGRIIDANQTMLEMVGYSKEEVLGLSVLDFLPPESQQDVVDNLETNHEEPYETLVLRNDGSTIPIEVHAKMLLYQGRMVRVASVRDLRERKESQNLLKESQQRLIEAQRIAKIGHYVLDVKSGYWSSSAQLDKIFGIDGEFEKNTQGWETIIHPDHREELSNYLTDHVIGKHQKFDKEYKIINRSDQKTYWVHGIGDLKFDDSGNVAELVGTIQDITKYRKAAQALQESEQRFRTLFSNSPDAYLIIEIERGQIIECNRAAEIMLRGERNQIIGLTPVDLSPEIQPDGKSSLAAFTASMEDLSRIGRHNFEWVHRRLDGSDFWVEVSSTLASYEGREVFFVSWREIGYRKQVEIELRQSEERFRATINATPVPKVLVDGSDHIVFLNPAFMRLFGYSLDDIPTLADWWLKACPDPEYRDQTVRKWRERTRGEGDHSAKPMEMHLHCKNGKICTVLVEGTRLTGVDEESMILITLIDISQQRSVTNRLKTLLDNASDGIHILDEQGNVVEFSQSFALMLGYTPEETAQLNVADWEARVPRGEQQTVLKEFIKNQSTFETQHRRKDGSIYDVEINAKGVILDGQPFLYASARDITERKKMEKALQDTKRHLTTVINTIPDLIWLKDKNGVYLACNLEFELFFGASEQQILGKTDYDFVSPDLADFFREKDQEAITAGRVNINEEEVVYRSDGRRVTLETRKVPFQDATGDVLGILGIGRDVTERKLAEQALQEANEKLQGMAMQDGLTHVANRRQFDLKLAEEWSRMMREKKPLSLIIFDVDFFKRYNDTYGHLAGDACLQTISSKARDCIRRPGDLLARYGGEEFAVILPNTDNAGAFSLTEKLRRQIYEIGINHEASMACPFVTISCGVATIIPKTSANFQMLLETADRALYEAKEGGRNMVVSRKIH